MDKSQLKQAVSRLIKCRSQILGSHPFFGRLLMRMPFGFAECHTACTDMQRIIFDPSFVARLSDTELCFVMMHEVMHCVLKHCTRAVGKLNQAYNIACDIVVNSVILEAMGIGQIKIDGCEPVHLTPDGKEGSGYSAEEVYEMLLKEGGIRLDALVATQGIDSHDSWGNSGNSSYVEAVWDSYIKNAGKSSGGFSGIPVSLQRYVSDIYHTPSISWKQILHDYIQNDNYDYIYSIPDKRYNGDCIMPSFSEIPDDAKLENVFFFVDTSGSVTSDALAEAFEEIKDAVMQIGNVTGNVLFFDTEVSDAYPFESIEDIEKIKPVGGGGTRFRSIFEHLSHYDEEMLPRVIIIITDGYCEFPAESEVPDIPVIWLIVNSDVEAPWGECLHIYEDQT